MHYIFIALIIALIVFYQIKIYVNTRAKLRLYIDIFPEGDNAYSLQKYKLEEIKQGRWTEHKAMLKEFGHDILEFAYTGEQDGVSKVFYYRDKVINFLTDKLQENGGEILTNHNNPVFSIIVTSINDYLSVNKSGASDFHLMKDIVDRNCDIHEEEINTQIPIPLYLGLMGTMGGILIGIGYLWLSGGLSVLLNTGNQSSGANGVEVLLGGVALAMIASIVGIYLTTKGSLRTKDAKSIVEKSKHAFLSWMSAKLLPNLSNDVASTMEKMSQNLVSFNKTFSSNTLELGKTLNQVKETSLVQTQLLNAVKQIADKDIPQKNLELLNALKNSTNEIGLLGSYLNHVNEYLANVKALNEKLDASEQRTKAIEEMYAFFKSEIQQVEARKGLITKAVGTVDSVLEEALRKLKDNAEGQLEELKKTTAKQYDFLQQNSQQINNIVAELKNLTAVKESIQKFEQAARAQNTKFDTLANAIQALAKAKVEGTPIKIIKPSIPIKKKVLIWSIAFCIGVPLLFLILANGYLVINLLSAVVSLFKF
jgi:hypothetical protein